MNFDKTFHGPSGGRGITGGIKYDSREFDARFTKFMTKDSISSLREGLGNGGEAFMGDILDEAPKAPELTSALRSSISVFVNRALKATSIAARKPDLDPVDYLVRINNEPKKDNEEQALVVVNAPYATFQHETYHKGFVFSKLSGFGTKYLTLIATPLKRLIR